MDTEIVKARAKTPSNGALGMKWALRLKEKFGSLRVAAEKMGGKKIEPHQRIDDHMDKDDKGRKQREFLNRLRKARKALGLTIIAFYGEIEAEVEEEFEGDEK